MQDEKEELQQSILSSFCEVCFVPFGKLPARKLEEGLDVLYCVKCKCRTHRCCYDMEATSTFISPKFREFVCQKCSKKETASKACLVCHRKDGPMKVIENDEVVHVFCALTHNEIETISFYPELLFRKSKDYKNSNHKCGICSKANANQNCAMESCNKKFHGYCVWMNLKKKQDEEDEPQCEKYYFQTGDCGQFDLSKQILPKSCVYEEFNKSLVGLEDYGFIHPNKQELKQKVYQVYEEEEIEDKNQEGQSHLRRGGFAYVLCKDHERSLYCNCMDKGSGDMVQCECCFEWYHQKCVNYNTNSSNEQYICPYCISFYDLKKKIIDEVKGTKVENYELRWDQPKLHLLDFIWLLRVIDHRISGGQAGKMVKELAKYPLKTSKIQIVIKFMNRKKLTNLGQEIREKFLESEEFKEFMKPKTVLKLDSQQKPVLDEENINYNKGLRKYLDYLQSWVRKISIREYLGSIVQELKFKQKVVADDSYENMMELSKNKMGYAEVPILQMKVQAYSFMQVIKDIDSGSEIKFQDLEVAVMKAKNCANVPDYLLKPLIQRYEKVKNLVQLVSKNIHQKQEVQVETENAIKKLKEEKILPPTVYQNFHQERRIAKELYLLYLKQQGKPLGEVLEIKDKINILASSPPCKPNREITDLISSYQHPQKHLHDKMQDIIEKYTKVTVLFEIKQQLKKKTTKFSLFSVLSSKYEKYYSDQDSQDEPQIKEVMQKWREIKRIWTEANDEYAEDIDSLQDIEDISSLLSDFQKVLNLIESLPLKMNDKNDEVPDLGSFKDIQKKIQILQILMRLNTQSQLKKNPFTIQKLPEAIPFSNPLVKNYFSLKKQHTELMNKYNKYYDRIKQKLQALKDQKRPRKELIKDNLEKPSLSQFTDFIQTLQNSRLAMEKQIKEVTNTINKSIEIASKVKKFMSEEKHLESIFNEKQIEQIKKEISELRKKVLLESQLCLDTEFKDLYQAEICIRMQHMMISPNSDLTKMEKLLKFAEEEGLDHLSTYARLKSTFQIGHQSTKEINQIKKHEQLLSAEASRQSKDRNSDFLFPGLVRLRKSLTLRIPKPLKQRNSRLDALLERNTFLKNKISMFLFQEPKKYDVEEIKPIYMEALKNPFEVEGLNKLIIQMEKGDKILKKWKNTKQHDITNEEIFQDYSELIFIIDEVQNAYKNVKQCEAALKRIQMYRQSECDKEGLEKVEQLMEKMERGNMPKNSALFINMKTEYFLFWRSYIEKCRQNQFDTIPYNKIRSLTIQLYYLVQKAVKFHINTSKFREIVQFFEELLFKILRHFESKKSDELEIMVEGYIDVEELKYEIIDGLNISEEIKPLEPYRDMSKFCYTDLTQVLMKPPDSIQQTAPIKRQRSQLYYTDPIFQDPYKHQSRLEKKKASNKQKPIESSGENQHRTSKKQDKEPEKKANSNNVTDRQRFKIKQILLKNMKKNSEFLAYEDLSDQVRLIENQLFGDYHNNIVKYLEMSDSFEKLFMKLTGFPNLSAKIVKKKFQWSFLKLLIQNKDNFNDMEKILIERNKDTNEQKGNNTNKKESKDVNAKISQIPGKKNDEDQKMKQKSVFEMIASGKLDESERKEMKKEIKAIKDREKEKEREKKKKKHHKSSRRRSRSRSRSRDRDRDRSPEARFSSDSQEANLPNYIEKEYGGQQGASYLQKIANPGLTPQIPSSYLYTSDPFTRTNSSSMPLMFNPDEEEDEQEGLGNKKPLQYPKGTILSIKKIDIELVLKKKGKISLKDINMLTIEDHHKIVKQLVDPAFSSPFVIRKDKSDQQIIQYLCKSYMSSRKKYKFLVGWFESIMPSQEKETQKKDENEQEIKKMKKNNETIKQFSIETNSRQKIFGIQNQHLKMHIMSIKQYVRILNPGNMNTFCQPPQWVTSKVAHEALKEDRLIFVIQYPAQKMYELKGIYQNFSKVEPVQVKDEEGNDEEVKPVREGQTYGYKVEVPENVIVQQFQPQTDYSHPYSGHVPYLQQQSHNPYIQPYGHNPVGNVIGQSHYENSNLVNPEMKTIQYEGWGDIQEQPMGNKKMDSHNLNNLGRFSPILTDQQNQDRDTGNREKENPSLTEKNDNEQNQNNRFANMQKRASITNINDDDGDFASNILNALGNSDFQPPQTNNSSIGRDQRNQQPTYQQQGQPNYHSYPSIPQYGQRPPSGMYPPPPPPGQGQGGYSQQTRWTPPPPSGAPSYVGPANRMMYNPMAVSGQNRNQMMPPPTPNMMYSKNNPMMGHQSFYPPPPPPPAGGSQGNYGGQVNQGQYGQGYQRQ